MQFRGHPNLTRKEIGSLLDLCHKASEGILQCYYDEARSGLLSSKEDQTPLTKADLASHEILSHGLHALRP